MMRSDRLVIVVDDDAETLRFVREALEENGYATRGISRPEDAWPQEDERPYAYVLDLRMPGLDGIALARRLGAGKANETRMVGMSAFQPMVALAERSGLFKQVLLKPVDVDMLVLALNRP